MSQIHSILHLHVGKIPNSVTALIDAQKNTESLKVDILELNEQTAKEALKKVFASDSVCVWSEQTPFVFKN